MENSKKIFIDLKKEYPKEYQTACDLLKVELDKKVEELEKEDSNKHITYNRKKAIELLNLQEINPYGKKGYYIPKNCLAYGSEAGFDNLYFVKLPEKYFEFIDFSKYMI